MTIFRYKEPLYKRELPPLCSCHGTEEVDDFKLEFPVTGGVRLKKVGTKPLYKQIQANKVNCDLSSVLEQCVHQNQLAVCDINDVTSAIADFSGLSSMSEWYAGMKHLEQVWSDTPLEVREKFGSSKVQFINSIGTPDFNKKLQSGYEAYSAAFKKRIDVPTPSPAPDLTPSPAPEQTPSPAPEQSLSKGSDE